MRQTTKGSNDLLKRERVVVRGAPGGPVKVCLVYPNTYRVGMSNLGYQAVLGIFQDRPEITCDRAFLPDAEAPRGRSNLRSLELGRPLSDFDIVAFSVSFETDYLNILTILDAAGIPMLAVRRSDCDPLVIGGGPVTFINPEPIADFFDLLLVGEAEELLPEFIEELLQAWGKGKSRPEVLDCVEQVEGVYRPAAYRYARAAGEALGLVRAGAGQPARVKRRYLRKLDQYPTSSRIIPAESVFDEMFLIEASRGCQWGCRFCAAGFIYRPVRYRGFESLSALARTGLEHVRNIGLVGAELGSLPGLTELCELVADSGGRVSPSSLRADTVTEKLASGLRRGETRTVTIAPEAGSERLRRVINKDLSEDAMLEAAARLGHGGVRTLRLYFMIGLPTERDEDIEEIVALTDKIRCRFLAVARGARVRLSISPFVPKPWTPFQWDGMEDVALLKRKVALLRRKAGAFGGVVVEAGSVREAYYQTLLSRGDRRVASLLLSIHERGGRWWPVIQELRRATNSGLPSPDDIVHQTFPFSWRFPWDVIEQGVSKKFLWRERQKALANHGVRS